MDGSRLWSVDLGRLDIGAYDIPTFEWGPASSPIIWNNLVILQCDTQADSFVVALDVETGATVWKTAREELPSWGTPTIVTTTTGPELVTNASNYIRGYDPRTGRELWRIGRSSKITAPTPVFGGGLWVIASGRAPERPIFAVRSGARGDITPPEGASANQAVVWSRTNRGSYMPTPLIYGDLLILANGILDAYDLRPATIYQRCRTSAAATVHPLSPPTERLSVERGRRDDRRSSRPDVRAPGDELHGRDVDGHPGAFRARHVRQRRGQYPCGWPDPLAVRLEGLEAFRTEAEPQTIQSPNPTRADNHVRRRLARRRQFLAKTRARKRFDGTALATVRCMLRDDDLIPFRGWRPNILLVGPSAASLLPNLLSQCRAPVHEVSAKRVALMPDAGTVVLRDVADSDLDAQRTLFDWLEAQGGHVQVITVAPAPLFPLVGEGGLSEALFYRLNVVTAAASYQ
jgi:hypothetical protein